MPQQRSPFGEVLESLRLAFSDLDAGWYVFGAQAAIVHGSVRMTADVDVTVHLGGRSLEQLTAALVQHGFDLRTADEDFFRSTSVVPVVHQDTGINADVVVGGSVLEETFLSRALERDLGGAVVPVACAEDVVAMKILSGRSKDLDDVAAILAAQREFAVDLARQTLAQLEAALDRSDLVDVLEDAMGRATK